MIALKLLHRTADALFWAAGILVTVYLAAATFGYVRNSSEHYSNFVLAALVMSGLTSVASLARRLADGEPARRLGPALAVAILATIGAAASAGYIRLFATELEIKQPFFSAAEFNVGLLLTASVLVLTWIHWGGLLTGVIAAAIVYFFFGHHIDNQFLGHPEYDANFVMNYIGLGTTEGFFWFAREAADSVWFLVIFAGVLFGVGSLHMVIELGKLAGRRFAGGASFPALVGSGIVSAIMGTAVSNVVLSGRFTIPMMKRYGYRPSMAGAIEATASTAGQIMPPVLGLAAFIIAALLNIAYVDVAMAALIPALLYMSGVTIAVIVYARRQDLPRLTEPVDMVLIWRMLPTFAISFGVVLWLLLAYYSPSMAGLVGCAVAVALGLTQGRFRPKLSEFVSALREALEMAAVLALVLIAIGPLAQTFLTTNLSRKLGTFLLIVLPNSEIVVLIAGGLLALVLGMGLPTPVAYILVALAVVPYLQEFGVPALVAHFFVFYFACYSTLTPPVAVSVLAASRLAGASFLETARDSMALMLTTIVIPFAFVYYPALMSFPNIGWDLVLPLATVLVLQWTVAVACFGHFRRVLSGAERLWFWGASAAGYVALVDRGYLSNVVFFAAVIAAAVWIPLRESRARAVSIRS